MNPNGFLNAVGSVPYNLAGGCVEALASHHYNREMSCTQLLPSPPVKSEELLSTLQSLGQRNNGVTARAMLEEDGGMNPNLTLSRHILGALQWR